MATNRKPSLFVGSSSEGLPLARAVRTHLEDQAAVTVWNEGSFELSTTNIESLVTQSSSFEFAVIIFTPDDLIQARNVEELSPRDNVIFELGIFIGGLGRDRTFLLCPSGRTLKMPSDLAGFVSASYDWSRAEKSPIAAVGSACDRIREAVRRPPPRRRTGEQERMTGGPQPHWGELYGELLDGALYVSERDAYVDNPKLARDNIGNAIIADGVIPTRYHYSSDALAKLWVNRCRERSYRYQYNTVKFWRGHHGRSFATKVLDAVGDRAFDFVSLGPGDGEKDAAVLRHWLNAGVNIIYYPYDASYPLLVRAVRRVSEALGKDEEWRVKAVLADFLHLETIRTVFEHRSAPNVISLLGNLGNLGTELLLLGALRETMSSSDLLMLEVRLQSEDVRRAPQETLKRMSAGSSLEHDFGPLKQYFSIPFQDGSVESSWDTEASDIEGTMTFVTTYRGEVPGLGERHVKLQYVHLYDVEAFREVIQQEGFDIVHEHPADTCYECLLRRRQ